MKTVIPELLETHLKLLELLEAKHKAWNDQQSVGDAFIKIFPNFIVYTNYVRGFNNADKTLKKCLEENKSFKAFIDV